VKHVYLLTIVLCFQIAQVSLNYLVIFLCTLNAHTKNENLSHVRELSAILTALNYSKCAQFMNFKCSNKYIKYKTKIMKLYN